MKKDFRHLVGRLVTGTFLTVSLLSVPMGPLMAKDITYSIKTEKISMRPMEGQPTIYEFLVNDSVVLRYRSMYQGLTAQERAEIIIGRARNFSTDLLEGPIKTDKINGSPVVLVDGDLFITVTEGDWTANNSTGDGLAQVWSENLNKALKEDKVQLQNQQPSNVMQVPMPSVSGSGNIQQPSSQEPLGDEQPADNTPVNPNPTTDRLSVAAEEQEMLNLINQERKQAGLKPLTMDTELVKVARLKSQDMIDKNYFDHNSPTYGDPFKMLSDFDITYGYAGENLAGNPSMIDAHRALMESPGHRRNILNTNYTHVGIGIVEGGTYGKMVTQLFISKSSNTEINVNTDIQTGEFSQPEPTPRPTPTPTPTPAPSESHVEVEDSVPSQSVIVKEEERKMLELINKERALVGAAPLTLDTELVKVARLKSQDMIDKNYFDHTSPTYGDPFKMMGDFGITFSYAGENLAGNPSMTDAHKALMESPGHRRNILNTNYTHVGIGIIDGGTYGKMFTQLFIKK